MFKRIHLAAALGALALVGVAACGSDGGEAGGPGDTKVSITSPKEDASVSAPFKLKVKASAALGSTESGKHHVHLYFDGRDDKYEIVEDASWDVPADSPALAGLKPGEHTMHVSLRNADHSAAGAENEIKVTVGGSAAESPSTDDGNSGGYGY